MFWRILSAQPPLRLRDRYYQPFCQISHPWTKWMSHCTGGLITLMKDGLATQYIGVARLPVYLY